jgi:Immunity protein 21
MTTTWIDTAGGPLICATNQTGPIWCGTRGSSIGEVRTDYDRACEVMSYVGVVRCASSDVLVFGDEPLQTTFVSVAGGLAAVRWVSCTSVGEADAALAAIPSAMPQLEAPKSLLIRADKLVMFDAAYRLKEAPQSMATDVVSGLYEVSTERFARPGVFEFIVHRMVRSPETRFPAVIAR